MLAPKFGLEFLVMESCYKPLISQRHRGQRQCLRLSLRRAQHDVSGPLVTEIMRTDTIPGLSLLPSPKLTTLDQLIHAAVLTGDHTHSINISFDILLHIVNNMVSTLTYRWFKDLCFLIYHKRWDKNKPRIAYKKKKKKILKKQVTISSRCDNVQVSTVMGIQVTLSSGQSSLI